jgi:hypothetical protein
MDLEEVVQENVDWIHLAQSTQNRNQRRALVNVIMNIFGFNKKLETELTISF